MSTYIQSANNPRFFREVDAKIGASSEIGSKIILGVNQKRGFIVENNTLFGPIARVFKGCTGNSYDLYGTQEYMLTQVASTLQTVNPEALGQNADEKNNLAQELLAASKTCYKFYTVPEAKNEKLKNETEQKNDFHTKSFDALNAASELLREQAHLVACKNGLFDMALELLDQGADITRLKEFYNPLLKKACEKGQFDRAIELIARGADASFAKDFFNPLFEKSLLKKQLFVTEQLILAGADLNQANSKGFYPLFFAVQNDFREDIIKLMISKDAKVSQENPNGHTALSSALTKRKEPLALFLLDSGAECSLKVFTLSLEKGFPQVANKIVDKGLDLTQVNAQKESALHIALRFSFIEVLLKLLEKGADANKKDDTGNTALHKSCMKGQLEYTQVLLTHKADPTLTNNDQLTPFQAAKTSDTWKADKNKMVQFFSRAFKDFPAVANRIRSSGINDIENYLTRNPLFVGDPSYYSEGAIPLEVAFLFHSQELAKALAQDMTKTEFTRQIEALKTKYPTISLDLIELSIYEFNLGHLKLDDIELQVPPKPEGYEVSMLMEMFDTLNFNDPNADDYINAETFKDDTGGVTFKWVLKSLLKQFVNRIETREAYTGTPSRDQPEELERFYKYIEDAVTNTIKKLKEMQNVEEAKKMKAKVLVEYIRAANYCGGKYYAISFEQYVKVVLGRDQTFKEIVGGMLADQREVILRSIVPTYRDQEGRVLQDVHDFNQLMIVLGVELAIRGAKMMAAFKDRYGRRYNKEDKKREFFNRYTPFSVVCDWLEPRIHREGGLRDKYIDWVKENVPKEWGQTRFDPIKEEVKQQRAQNVEQAQIIEMLQQKYEIFTPPDWTPEQAIEDERIMSFVGKEAYVDVNDPRTRLKKTLIAYMLHRQGVLKEIKFKAEQSSGSGSRSAPRATPKAAQSSDNSLFALAVNGAVNGVANCADFLGFKEFAAGARKLLGR